MRVAVECSACRGLVSIEASEIGTEIVCPLCQATTVASAVEPPPPAEPITIQPVDEAGPPAGRPVDAAAVSRRWRRFARGCRLVQLGLVLEFLAAALMSVVLIVAATEPVWSGAAPEKNGFLTDWWSFVFAAFFGLLTVPAGIVLVGRLLAAGLPGGSGARGLLVTNTLFSGFRFLALAAATAAMTAAGTLWLDSDKSAPSQRNRGWKDSPPDPRLEANAGASDRYTGYGTRAYGLAVLAGTVAEFAMIPGFAIVAGFMPSARLRAAAGTYTLVVQLIVLLYVGLLTALYSLDVFADLLGPPPPRNPNGPRPEPPNPVYVGAVAGAAVFALLVLQTVHTYLLTLVYGRARKEGLKLPPPTR